MRSLGLWGRWASPPVLGGTDNCGGDSHGHRARPDSACRCRAGRQHADPPGGHVRCSRAPEELTSGDGDGHGHGCPISVAGSTRQSNRGSCSGRTSPRSAPRGCSSQSQVVTNHRRNAAQPRTQWTTGIRRPEPEPAPTPSTHPNRDPAAQTRFIGGSKLSNRGHTVGFSLDPPMSLGRPGLG